LARVDSYEQGVPSWIEHVGPDLDGAKRYYGRLFGWEFDTGVDDDSNGYSMAQIDGDPVAGLSGQQPYEQGQPARWNVYLAVDDVDAAAGKTAEAGGTVLSGPFDIGVSGRMAFVQDPVGAAVGLWQGRHLIGSCRAREPGTNGWNELMSDDVGRAAPFYAAVLALGTETSPMPGTEEDYTTFTVGGRPVAGAAPPPDGVSPHWNAYLYVEDIDDAADRATVLGGNEVAPRMDIPGVGRFAFLSDPFGAAFCLMVDPPEE